jgi:uncharacterized protein YdaU (DUF1376 family)
VKEWCADQQIYLMTDQQVGWYIWLLVECWKGEGTLLTTDLSVLAKLARASSGQQFKDESRQVLLAFDEAFDEDGKGILIHRKMSELWIKQNVRHQQHSAAGKKSGEARARKAATS